MANKSETLKVLFVCIGNSCRSPMAEAVMRHLVKNNPSHIQWELDSAGIMDWNVGRAPEPRCLRILSEHDMTSEHIGRQITTDDFYAFDYIFGMDKGNIDDLEAMAPCKRKAKIELLGNYCSGPDTIIVDPYFETGMGGFDRSYAQIADSCENFLKIKIEASP